MVERTVTSALVIERACQELRMTEEQLLVHLVIEHLDTIMSPESAASVAHRARMYHLRGVFTLDVEPR